MDEIIQIPNQNGIIFGPGGVGKTALLIELCRQLLEDESPEPPLFNNLIWVSAKRDFYDPTLDEVQPGTPQFKTLENVLTAILEFHGFEDANGYTRDEKKWLVLESLRDEKTLLILDNLESIPAPGQKEIVRFFSVDAKLALKDKPDYFKVIVTSREQIACAFHQISLKGLDKRESKELMRRLYEPYIRSGLPQLTEAQLEALYEATRGIPLIIKHCYGQIYEYSRPVEMVLAGLSNAGNKVVEFSFAEIFQLLKDDLTQLRVILLLELTGRSLMLRQIADILTQEESRLADYIARLINFQCVNRVSAGGEEDKYAINDEVKFFTRRLALEYPKRAVEIKQLITNMASEKLIDYSRQEFEAATLFQEYISQKRYLLGDDFIREQLKIRPQSILLNLHYAKYLKEVKYKCAEAIDHLEEIRIASGNNQQVLQLLMDYHTALEFPNFEQGYIYARELEDVAAYNVQVRFELGKFYITWSTAIKKQGFDIDPTKEMLRKQHYKELAQTALKLLSESKQQSSNWHYLMAQCYFNLWDNDKALLHVDQAIRLLSNISHLYPVYARLKNEIIKMKTESHYSQSTSA